MALSIVGFSTLFAALALAQSPEPQLIFTDLASHAADKLQVMAATPKGQKVLGTLDVLPGMEPFSSLSQDGRYAFFARHTHPNHPEMTAELYRMDLVDGRLELISKTADASFVQPLGGPDVAWMSTLAIHPIDEARTAQGELFPVDVAIFASVGGREVRLCQLDGIYGAHFAGIAEGGIVLYVVRRKEAAFYLLPLEKPLADKLNGPIRGLEPSIQKALDKNEIESTRPEVSPSGIVRLAKAPEGPFARDFVVSGQTLLFGSRLKSVQNGTDEGENALYALDVTAPEALWTAEKGREVKGRGAIRLENTGKIHPNPMAVSETGQFFFSRADETQTPTRRHLISAIQLSKNEHLNRPDVNSWQTIAAQMAQAKDRWQKGQAPSIQHAEDNALENAPLMRRQELMGIRGLGRVVAAHRNGEKLALERRFEGENLNAFGQAEMKVELLWVDVNTKKTAKIEASEIHDVLGFSEVAP